MPVRSLIWTGTEWHSIRDGNLPPAPEVWPFDKVEPWRRVAGESIFDGIDPSVPKIKASDFTSSTDIYDVLQAIDSASSVSGGYVKLDAKKYFLNDFKSYGTNYWKGFANSNYRVMGILGVEPDVGGDLGTQLQISPTAVNDTPGARNYVLNPPTDWAPVQVNALRFSNTGSSIPIAIAGIDFIGTLQRPYGVYSAAVQSAKFDLNKAVSSPLAWAGLQLSRALPGTRVQFCRFRGFSYCLVASPPFETSPIGDNVCAGTYRRIEIDGRIAAEIDPTRPLASGGVMTNKALAAGVHLEDLHMHHTRRSGWAINTSTNDRSERYYGKRVYIHDIANANDGFAEDSGLFHASNVEEVVGQFIYEDVYLNAHPSRFHINLAEPNQSSGGGDLNLPPVGTPIIKLTGFRTDDTLYGGCLRINVSKTPNSSGISQAWQRLTDLGIAGSGLFDIRDQGGKALTGVKASLWNSSMSKADYYVVNY